MTTSVELSTFPRFKWIHRESPGAFSERRWESLATELACSPLLARVLFARGIENAQDATKFLKPERKHIFPPESIPGNEKATDRILRAIADDEGILVHGDYDVDGIVGAVILHKTLKELGAQSGIFLPKRDFHGFGLSPSSVEIAKANGVKLIVSVDCGISSHETVQMAHDAGIEVIVTDHHAITNDPPGDTIIVHPELDGDYPGGK
ncbi:MAG: DHH family phosphoesterase, partial [bacterium]